MNKSQADEKLQEIRSKNHESKIRYRKRVQEQQESDEYLKETLTRMKDEQE